MRAWNSSGSNFFQGKDCETLIFDVNPPTEIRKVFVEFFTEEKVDFQIDKMELNFFRNKIEAVFISLFLIFFTTLIYPFCLLGKFKGNWALVVDEFFAAFNLLRVSRKLRAQKIYKFSTYENASALHSILLRKKGIKVFQVVAEGSLEFQAKILIADCAILTIPFQVAQLLTVGPGFRANEFKLWMPESSLYWVPKYFENENLAPPTFDLGYYSSAYWLRRELGEADLGFGEEKASSMLEDVLKEFLLHTPACKLIVFLHPKERAIEFSSRAIHYYEQVFGKDRITVFNPELKSVEHFSVCNLGISVASTALMERLYCGYKGFFFCPGMFPAPVPEEEGKQIIFREKFRFQESLNHAFPLSPEAFFQRYSISKWRFSEQKDFLKWRQRIRALPNKTFSIARD